MVSLVRRVVVYSGSGLRPTSPVPVRLRDGRDHLYSPCHCPRPPTPIAPPRKVSVSTKVESWYLCRCRVLPLFRLTSVLSISSSDTLLSFFSLVTLPVISGSSRTRSDPGRCLVQLMGPKVDTGCRSRKTENCNPRHSDSN